MYEAEIFFSCRRGLYLDIKKFQLCTSIPDFFTIFQKSRSFLFKYTVERRIVSLRSSTEDFSMPALCEVGCAYSSAILRLPGPNRIKWYERLLSAIEYFHALFSMSNTVVWMTRAHVVRSYQLIVSSERGNVRVSNALV